MILLSPDAVEDVERLRSFLDQNNPGERSDIRHSLRLFREGGRFLAKLGRIAPRR